MERANKGGKERQTQTEKDIEKEKRKEKGEDKIQSEKMQSSY